MYKVGRGPPPNPSVHRNVWFPISFKTLVGALGGPANTVRYSSVTEYTLFAKDSINTVVNVAVWISVITVLEVVNG